MQKFLSSPQTQKVRLLALDPQEGPDGFPYIMVSDEGELNEPFLNLVHWGAEKGIGLVVNPQKENPDLVLTYGMLWNYLARGEFYTQSSNQSPSGDLHLENNNQLFAGHPSEDFWPQTHRKIFKEFLLQQGIIQPKVIMLADKAEGPMDIAFSLESLGQPQKAEWQGILEAFSWFFPRHYSLSIVSEKNIVGLSFLSL